MQPTRRNIFSAVLPALVLAFISTAARCDLKVGDSLPDLTTFKLEGRLPDSLKGKVVLVDFWASWCLPCAESFPAMNELRKEYGDRGLVIIAVNVDEKQTDMERFLKKHPSSFLVVRDAEHKLVEAFHPPTMPTSFLVDRKGKVRFLHKGFRGKETSKEYRTEIESLLNEKP